MIGFEKNGNADYAKHPSTMFYKWKNKDKKFVGWNKDKGENVSYDPVGNEYTVVGLGWTFSGFDPITNSGIYCNEVPYNKLQGNEIDVFAFERDKEGNSRRISLYSGKYDKNTTKELLKGKGANLFLCVHYIEGDHIETMQLKGLNCSGLINALNSGALDLDTYNLKITGTSTEKFKVITYEDIKYENGSKITDKERGEIERLGTELKEYYIKKEEELTGIVSNDIANTNVDANVDDEFDKDLPF